MPLLTFLKCCHKWFSMPVCKQNAIHVRSAKQLPHASMRMIIVHTHWQGRITNATYAPFLFLSLRTIDLSVGNLLYTNFSLLKSRCSFIFFIASTLATRRAVSTLRKLIAENPLGPNLDLVRPVSRSKQQRRKMLDPCQDTWRQQSAGDFRWQFGGGIRVLAALALVLEGVRYGSSPLPVSSVA